MLLRAIGSILMDRNACMTIVSLLKAKFLSYFDLHHDQTVTEEKPINTIFTPFLLVDFYMLYLLLLHCTAVHTFNYLNVKNTTLSNGYLGSRNDEERSEMRYVMRIAEFSESSNL